MPYKPCPKCSKDNGVRTLKCKCGYEYIHKAGSASIPPRPSVTTGTRPPAIPDSTSIPIPVTDAHYRDETTGESLPLAIVKVTQEALDLLRAGAMTVPCVVDGMNVWLSLQVLEGKKK